MPRRHFSEPAAAVGARLVGYSWNLGRGRPLDQLDAGAPRIGDVGEGDAGLGLPDRLIKLDALRADLLDKGLQVLQIEADVVEHAPFGGSLRRIGLGESELDARDVHDRSIVASACLSAKSFRIPRLGLGDLRFRQEEVYMLVA